MTSILQRIPCPRLLLFVTFSVITFSLTACITEQPAPTAIELPQTGQLIPVRDEPDVAISTFTKLIRQEPTNADAYLGRGEAYYRKDAYAEALADVNKALQLNPNDPFAYSLRAMIYQALQQYDKARADFERAVSNAAMPLDV